jgi:asparagine synthase (glutamine-hydrolysing)
MINQYIVNSVPLTLASDLAGEFPLYLYLAIDKQTLFYSESITELLNEQRIPKPLKVSAEGLSFLLQSGVVPPPKTAYENVFILGIGDSVEITSNNGCVILTFKHDFPFLNANRLSPAEMQPDEDLILKMIAEATIERIDDTKPTYLFHSAGKDSNTIALALAEAGLQDKVTLITHQSKGDSDESHISKEIADRLGFKHEILHESIDLNSAHKQEIEAYFESAPFPVTDNATLAYPLYLAQKPELKNANIIDGSGNDVYIGHIPSSTEFKRQKFSAYFSKLRPLTKYAQSESFLHILGRARSEWVGLSGISYADTKKY